MEDELLRELYENHSDAVYFFLLGKSGSEEIAFDLMQETFLRANAYYKGAENIKAWLLTVARNLFIDFMKKKQRQNETEQDGDFFSRIPSSENLESKVEWGMLKSAILSKLSSENPFYPELFLLRIDYELTHKEISAIVNIPFRTVRRHFEKIRNIIYNNFREELNLSVLQGQLNE